ncbi:MAG: hypothetical protein V1725_03105, partial [archaeon]
VLNTTIADFLLSLNRSIDRTRIRWDACNDTNAAVAEFQACRPQGLHGEFVIYYHPTLNLTMFTYDEAYNASDILSPGAWTQFWQWVRGLFTINIDITFVQNTTNLERLYLYHDSSRSISAVQERRYWPASFDEDGLPVPDKIVSYIFANYSGVPFSMDMLSNAGQLNSSGSSFSLINDTIADSLWQFLTSSVRVQ